MQHTALPYVHKPSQWGRPNPSAKRSAQNRPDDRFVLDKGNAGTFIGWSPLEVRAVEQLFDGLALVPAQWAADPADSGERRIRLAVLVDALRCIRGTATIPGANVDRPTAVKRERMRALEWMLCEDSLWPYSCSNICLVLGIEHATIKQWAQQIVKEERHD